MSKAINEMTSREAMGLPSHFVDSITNPWQSQLSILMGYSPERLRNQMENSLESLASRWLAGTALAMMNDPTIETLMPPMIDIPANDAVSIGLETAQIEGVTASLKDLLVQRDWIAKEAPRHPVAIKAFRLCKFPVTNKEYKQFLEQTNFEEIPTSWSFGHYPWHKSNHPVHTISVAAAEAYCQWLSSVTHRRFRLPTEYEWEYAASGPNENEFPWGNSFSNEMANTVELGILDTSPVGMFPLGNSEFGVADMAGNVEEFVANDYRPYPAGELIEDDLKVALKTYRVARGGSFTRYRDLARNKRRHGAYPKDIYVMGFRLAEDL